MKCKNRSTYSDKIFRSITKISMNNPQIVKTIYLLHQGLGEHTIATIFHYPYALLSKLGNKQAVSIAQRVSKRYCENLLSCSIQS